MGRILLAIVILLLLGVLGTLGFAYFGDMVADPVENRQPVTLPGLTAPPASPPVSTVAAQPAAPTGGAVGN